LYTRDVIPVHQFATNYIIPSAFISPYLRRRMGRGGKGIKGKVTEETSQALESTKKPGGGGGRGGGATVKILLLTII
jgi:hypothetical protein